MLNRYALQAVGPIHIIVKNGDVTLEGVVAREMEKNVAFLQANSVPGVFSVTNNLRVENQSLIGCVGGRKLDQVPHAPRGSRWNQDRLPLGPGGL